MYSVGRYHMYSVGRYHMYSVGRYHMYSVGRYHMHSEYKYWEIVINRGVLIFVDFVVHLNYKN